MSAKAKEQVICRFIGMDSAKGAIVDG